MMELADLADSKSVDRDIVRVQIPPAAPHATVAQLAEQLICNQLVVGSSPIGGSAIILVPFRGVAI